MTAPSNEHGWWAQKRESPPRSDHVPPTPAWRRPVRVVIVDDHRLIRRVLAHLLSYEADLEVVGEAADGREAVALARELRPDLVIMDVAMAGLDGMEATRRIAAELPEVRVLGLSMHEEPETHRAMRLAGAEELLVKDGTSATLIAACRRLAGR